MLKKLSICTIFISTLMSSSIFADNLGIAAGNDVNIRKESSQESDVIRQAEENEVFTVKASKYSFYNVKNDALEDGYVKFDFFKIISADAQVSADDVNIRKEPSSASASLGKLNLGDNITVIGQADEWYAINHNGSVAYVSKDFCLGTFITKVPSVSQMSLGLLGIKSAEEKAPKEVPTISDDALEAPVYPVVKEDYVPQDEVPTINDDEQASSLGEQMVSYAKQFLGTPYVYGGTNLNSGVDCSGFTSSVYKHFGITLSRVSRDQISNGTPVSKSNLKPGDLVFFNTGGNTRISHVGMYIGNGQYIHSTDGGGRGVSISDLNSGYSLRTYYGACRVIA